MGTINIIPYVTGKPLANVSSSHRAVWEYPHVWDTRRTPNSPKLETADSGGTRIWPGYRRADCIGTERSHRERPQDTALPPTPALSSFDASREIQLPPGPGWAAAADVIC